MWQQGAQGDRAQGDRAQGDRAPPKVAVEIVMTPTVTKLQFTINCYQHLPFWTANVDWPELQQWILEHKWPVDWSLSKVVIVYKDAISISVRRDQSQQALSWLSQTNMSLLPVHYVNASKL